LRQKKEMVRERGQAKILAMSWRGPGKHIQVVEQDDGLLIKVTGIKQSIDLLIPIVVLVGLAYMAWRDHSWILALGSAFAFGTAIWSWFRNEDGVLQITDREILASGDLGGWSKGYVRLRWVDISGLDYRVGGEDGPSGLFARSGRWNATCIVAGLSREQSEEVITTIFQRFPYVVMAEDNDGWSLFGNGSELTTLGLSKPKK
jgi:hypothetical protein